MNLILILFGLIELGVLLVAGGVLLFACITRRWKLAAAVVALLVAGWFYLDSGDLYVRRSVAATEMVGEYHLDAKLSRFPLEYMGYKELSGGLILLADGTFRASHLPSCCLTGNEEKGDSTADAYRTVTGTWTVGFNPKVGGATLGLVADNAKIRRGANIVNDKGLGVDFEVFVSGDFYPVVFSRDHR